MVVLGQYNSVLLSIKLYWISKGLVCLYILEKVEIWSGDTDASLTHRQQNIVLLSFSPVSSLSWVTQLALPAHLEPCWLRLLVMWLSARDFTKGCKYLKVLEVLWGEELIVTLNAFVFSFSLSLIEPFFHVSPNHVRISDFGFCECTLALSAWPLASGDVLL